MATVDRNQQQRTRSSQSAPLERQLPRNLDAEKAVLGSILLLPQVFDEVALIIRPGDFYDDANRTLFEHLLQMHDAGQQIDPMLLVERLR